MYGNTFMQGIIRFPNIFLPAASAFHDIINTSTNPFMPSGLFYLTSLDRSISYIRDVWLVFIITIFAEKIMYLMQTM